MHRRVLYAKTQSDSVTVESRPKLYEEDREVRVILEYMEDSETEDLQVRDWSQTYRVE